MKEVDLLIFDLDGTLVDSKEDIAACVHLAIAGFGGKPVSNETIAEYLGVGIQSLIRKTFTNAETAERAVAHFDHCYATRLTNKTALYPGMAEVLDHYRAKKKIVLTNKLQKFADRIVDELGLRGHFHAVYGRGAFSAKKPDPLPVVESCSRFQTPPARAVVVGDTELDIMAGKGAGAVTVAARFGYGNAEALRSSRPDYYIDTPTELTALFK